MSTTWLSFTFICNILEKSSRASFTSPWIANPMTIKLQAFVFLTPISSNTWESEKRKARPWKAHGLDIGAPTDLAKGENSPRRLQRGSWCCDGADGITTTAGLDEREEKLAVVSRWISGGASSAVVGHGMERHSQRREHARRVFGKKGRGLELRR
mgnify:CR=1 FL=1